MQRLKQILLEPVPVWRDFLLHRQGNPETRRMPHRHSEEFRRRYADNRVHGRSDRDCLAGDRRISCKAIPPPGIAGYRYWMRSWRLVICAGKHASKRRIHAERVEVSTGNQLDAHFFQAGISREATVRRHQIALDRRDLRVDLVPSPEFAEERIRKDLRAPVREETSAARRLGFAEQNQLLRMAHRQIAKQDGIQQAENRRIGSNTQRKHQHRDDREARALQQLARRIV